MAELVFMLTMCGFLLHMMTDGDFGKEVRKVVHRAIDAWEKRNRPKFPEEVSADELTEEQADRILAADSSRMALDEFERELEKSNTKSESMVEAKEKFVERLSDHLLEQTRRGLVQWRDIAGGYTTPLTVQGINLDMSVEITVKETKLGVAVGNTGDRYLFLVTEPEKDGGLEMSAVSRTEKAAQLYKEARELNEKGIHAGKLSELSRHLES